MVGWVLLLSPGGLQSRWQGDKRELSSTRHAIVKGAACACVMEALLPEVGAGLQCACLRMPWNVVGHIVQC
jgi:hypothetical protein